MRKYELKSKCGEVINKTNTDNLWDAVAVFARVKKLTTESLLDIFVVVESTNN